MKTIPDVVYAEEISPALKLDLFLPEGVKNPPLIVHIHGGGWEKGTYKGCPVKWLVREGYAIASIQYRMSHQAKFPAQLHDCKGAVRWLRAHAKDYGYDADKVCAIGSSAGGHLSALLGTTGGMKELEGTVGGNLEQSSRVQAVVDYFGPTDFIERAKVQPKLTEDPGGSVYRLLGGPVSKNQELAKQASPLTHVDENDPPLMIIHGLMDRRVLVQQSIDLYQKYRTIGLPVEIRFIHDAAHGGSLFYEPQNQPMVNEFLEKYLRRPQPGKLNPYDPQVNNPKRKANSGE